MTKQKGGMRFLYCFLLGQTERIYEWQFNCHL